jgi:serine/threonine-protein kinase RsbW
VGSVRVAPLPASVGAVRSMLRDDLAVLPEPVREDVALVVSELLGNALRHARSLDDGRLAVDWALRDGAVEVAVTDGGGPTVPIVIEPAPTDIGGRGLSIVASVAARWGVEQHGQARTVWAIVPMRSQRLLHA